MDARTMTLYRTMIDDTLTLSERSLARQTLDCIDMIDSILTYGYASKINSGMDADNCASQILWSELQRPHSYLLPFTTSLGYDFVVSLVRDRINDIDHIEIGVQQDSEGNSYNSIVWKEIS